jgi:hypothetical protein
MDYKILEAHIYFNHPNRSHIVSVAIQSDVNEKSATHFKAYYKQCEGPEISMATFRHVASVGAKHNEIRAKEVFPSLNHLNYY